MNQIVSSPNQIFDYHVLRWFVGGIAFLIPVVVSVVSGESLSSISAYYYSDSRDYFVGMLCIVGALMMAYNGHTTAQMYLSKVAGVAAFGVAIFPTACATCESGPTSILHVASATTLFAILAYFCYVFYARAKGKRNPVRSYLYALCGVVIVLSLLAAAAGELFLSADDGLKKSRIIFYAEWSALAAFGTAWTLAGIYQMFGARQTP